MNYLEPCDQEHKGFPYELFSLRTMYRFATQCATHFEEINILFESADKISRFVRLSPVNVGLKMHVCRICIRSLTFSTKE